ncbi:conserved hypothetical protein [gamma proteobacterium NOR5-3]|nr:conserved hypothetical protein [gamma proteobacterium NOR5-3]
MLLMLWVTPARSALVWHWEDPFTLSDRGMLSDWLTQTHAALQRYAGILPFDVHVYMHRRDGAKEPVPWANTWRDTEQALHFYVDPDFSEDAFLSDWTAAHEFSHLLLPYLGSENAWFAEGFASYLQYALMVEMGVIAQSEADARRDKKMRAAASALKVAPLSLPESMPELKKRGAYPTFYWGGAIYFERVDAALRKQGTSLQSTLRQYLDCCRLQKTDLDGLAATLNALSGSSVFASELTLMRETPGIPPRPAKSAGTTQKRGP